MFYYVLLLALVLFIAALIAPAFRRRHAPTHCRCGRPADIIDHERPWKVCCAKCHLKRLRKKGVRV